MRNFTLLIKLVVLSGFLFLISAELEAQTGTLSVLASGPNSVVLKVDTSASTGFRVDYKIEAGAYDPITAFSDTSVRADGFTYLLHTGLAQNTEYTYRLTPFDGAGDGTPVETTFTTADTALWVHMSFDQEVNGKVANQVNGRMDTMINASIVPDGVFDGAVKFALKEVVPGVEYEYSYIFLDSALWDAFNTVVDAGQNWFARDYTELTYMFWFKDEQPQSSLQDGSTLAMFGDQASTGVTIYQDSLIFASGAKFGSENLNSQVKTPYNDSLWTHFAYVFKDGISDIYLNGEKVMTHDSSDKYYHSRLSTRMSDHWSKSMIGAAFWWNRALHGVYNNYGDKLFHNQFNGLMDEFKVYSYAVPESFITEEVAAALPEPASITQTAIGPSSIVVSAASTGADTVVFELQETGAEFAEATPAKSVRQNADFYLFDGLKENTEYTLKVSGINSIGTGEPALLTFSTEPKTHWISMDFENVVNGRVQNTVTGATDSLVNAEVVATGLDTLGNAVEFELVEVIPGVEFQYSYIFLDSAFSHVFNGQGNPNQPEWRTRDYTEASYAFWFKDNDPAYSSANGSALAMFGDQLSTGVTIYKDSIYLASGAKFGPTNIAINNGAPFDNSGNWNHLAVTYKNGIANLYLNGSVVVTLDESESGYFWNRFSLRTNDHWAKNMIGAAFWWNRALHGIYNTYGDKEFHNQFNGLMDEFNVYNYELTEQEILELVSVVLPEPATASLTAKGPNSVVIKANAAGADTIEFTIQSVEGETTTVEPSGTLTQNNEDYYLFDNLQPETEYIISAISVNSNGSAAATEVPFTTMAEMMMVHLDFESVSDGKVTDVVTGNADSLIHATIASSGCENIGNGVKFEEVTVGPEVVGSILFLDNTLGSYMDMIYNAGNGWKGLDFTEGSYSFWMKVGDTIRAKETGVALTVFGDQFGNGVGLFNDSIWVTSGGKFGPVNIGSKAGYPFSFEKEYVHITYVFKHGVTDLYLDGEKIITMDDTENYFWSRYSTRNDHWASSSLGGGYWWNRPMNSITEENFGDKMYHMLFDGIMDEFKVFSYALTAEEITDMFQDGSCVVGINDVKINELTVYPNPVSDNMYFGKELSGNFQILDITGKVFMNGDLSSATMINVSELKSGLYMLRLMTEDKVYISKFIKE